MKYVRLKRG